MKLFKNLRNGALAMSAAPVEAVMPTAFADGTTEDTIVKTILENVVLKIAFYIGIILLAWSVIMLVLAFKNEDADSKSRAIMLIVVSVVLIAIGPIMSAILSAAGGPTLSTT